MGIEWLEAKILGNSANKYEIERVAIGDSEKNAFESARAELIVLISGFWKGGKKARK